MDNMGNSCTMQRRVTHSSQNTTEDARMSGSTRSSLRHSVVCEVPDGSIASLYPVEDNYINVGIHGNFRSPKSLASLCVDAVCRSLPDLDGALPPHLPQDVVSDVIESLHRHSAWNTTTIQALRNCEFVSLQLSRCRGVNDKWLEPFRGPTQESTVADEECEPPLDMWLEPTLTQEETPSDIFYGAFDQFEGSSCSTASFVSASSDQLMDEAMDPSFFSEVEGACDYQPSQVYDVAPSVTDSLIQLDLRDSQGLTDGGLLQLTNLCCLRVAKLDGCHALTGRGLLAFSKSIHLHTLSMANCRRMTDEAVLNIAHLVSLQALSLDGCRCLTDRSLAAITDLKHLRLLDMSQCDLLTDDGIQYLEPLSLLEEIRFGWCREVTDQGIQILASQPGRTSNLKVLRLARCSINNVECLANLVELRELDLNGCANVKSRALAGVLEQLPFMEVLDVSCIPGILRFNWQGKIRALKSLELRYTNVRDAHLLQLTNQACLEELNLDSCPVGDTAMAHLADKNVVPNLKTLDLADTNVTDRGVAKIAKFTELTHLSLFYCNITNHGLRYIAKLTNLRALNLDSRDISDDGLYHLKKLRHLKSLDIFSGRITDSGCVHISKIRSLESLELCGGGIGDFGCSLIASLENLTCLNLSQNDRISNRGAAALAALSSLKALNLSNTRVNSGALKFFSGLLKLQSLALYGCGGVDSQTVEQLQGGLPNLTCLRLGASCEEDGMYLSSDGETNENEEDMWGALDEVVVPND